MLKGDGNLQEEVHVTTTRQLSHRAAALEVERQELTRAFKAHQIATPLSSATAVEVRMTCAAAMALLDDGQFDQAPVTTAQGAWIGWVGRRALASRAPDERVKAAMHHLSSTAIVSERAPIADVLTHLAQKGFVYTASGAGLVGFITPSDLERHAARNHFFVLVAGIEMLLSDLVKCLYTIEEIEALIPADDLPNPEPRTELWSAPRSLRDRYLSAKERRSETHPVEYLYLGQLTKLATDASSEGRLPGWGRSTASDLEAVRAIRPDVTHPTRSLIAGRDAKALCAVADAAERAHLALCQCLVQLQALWYDRP